MPANVESMFSVREMPWHREGTILQDYPGSWDEARTLAGLDWDPVAEPVIDTASVGDDGQLHVEYLEDWNKIVHSATRKVLTIRPSSYTLIDHGEMGMIVEEVLRQPNVKWETAGVLDGGKAVWCLAKLDEPIKVPGEISILYPYLGITNRHDGKASCALRATMVRIVCGNTFSAAELEGERTGLTYAFTHRKNWKDHLAEAREAVTGARREIADYVELATELTGIKITPGQQELFVKLFIPEPPETLITDRVARNIEQARAAVRGILDSQTTAGLAPTAYKLVQASGEYLDWARKSRSWETRLNRTLIRPEPLKARALTLAREVALADA